MGSHLRAFTAVLFWTCWSSCPASEYSLPSKSAGISVSDVTIHDDIDCFKIETPTATYVYGKRVRLRQHHRQGRAATGSLIVRAARRAASIGACPSAASRPSSSTAATATASITTDNPFSSRVTVRETGHVRIESETRDGKSACRVGLLPRPRDADAPADRSPHLLVPLRRNAGRQTRRRNETSSSAPTAENHARPTLVAGRALGLLRRGRDASRVRPVNHQARAGRGRLLRLLALPERAGRLVSGHDRLRLRPQGLQGTGRARPRPQAPARPLQHRLHRSGRFRDGQGNL